MGWNSKKRNNIMIFCLFQNILFLLVTILNGNASSSRANTIIKYVIIIVMLAVDMLYLIGLLKKDKLKNGGNTKLKIAMMICYACAAICFIGTAVAKYNDAKNFWVGVGATFITAATILSVILAL